MKRALTIQSPGIDAHLDLCLSSRLRSCVT